MSGRPAATVASPPRRLPELFDLPGIAAQLATTERHIRRLVAERRIPHLKIGGLLRFDPDEISEWLDNNRRAVQD